MSAAGIPVSSDNVQILEGPQEFYNEVIKGIKSAKRRVTLAALYIGLGDLEKQMVETLYETSSSNPDLECHIMMDYLRGTRTSGTKEPRVSNAPSSESSVTLLSKLKQSFPSRVRVSFFHSPLLSGLLKRWLPERTNEIVSVFHIKANVFDNDIIITGANLGDTYFTTRQDRYILIRNSPMLAEYFHNAIDKVSTVCYDLSTGGSLHLPSNVPVPYTHPAEFTSMLRQVLRSAFPCPPLLPASQDGGIHTTFVRPAVQMGAVGVRDDETLTVDMLSKVSPQSTIAVASGYVNFCDRYLDPIRHSKARLEVVTSSPQANSFYQSKGPSYYIPHAYTAMAKDLFDSYRKNGMSDKLRMFEYTKQGWSFHAKGMWVYHGADSNPSLTLLGSSNFGYRSLERDLECEVQLSTTCPKLQQRLQEEKERLFSNSQIVSSELFSHAERRVPLWLQWATRLFVKRFL
eukprot:GILK01010746.1.p1 GENE.GILK01010746.1~~GILK01010746.1.p1  ORF type:complete len:459 (-),score=38.28 GILK01010746.1:34-1410(-)